jgi:hypothetical protein
MKKIFYLFLALTVIACSKDEENQTPPEPTNFFEAHNGVWITTFSDTSQTLFDIDDADLRSYFRLTNTGCWSIPAPIGGTSTITTNTPEELFNEIVNIPAENVFSGDDLQILQDNGYNSVSVSAAYLDTPPSYISFAQIIYAGTFEVELLTISGNFGLQSNDYSYSLCLLDAPFDNRTINLKYEIDDKVRAMLRKN